MGYYRPVQDWNRGKKEEFPEALREPGQSRGLTLDKDPPGHQPYRLSRKDILGSLFRGMQLLMPFCHNPELVNIDLLDGEYSMTHRQIIEELDQREGFIDAVVLTGGEPLLHRENIELLRRIKGKPLRCKAGYQRFIPGQTEGGPSIHRFRCHGPEGQPGQVHFATGEGEASSRWKRARRSSWNRRAWTMSSGHHGSGVINAEDVLLLLDRFSPKKVRRYALQRFRSEENTVR